MNFQRYVTTTGEYYDDSAFIRNLTHYYLTRHLQLVQLGMDGNFTKNALHLAAWKGDNESIELLIDAGRKYGLDLVNVISTGDGNYGKTRE